VTEAARVRAAPVPLTMAKTAATDAVKEFARPPSDGVGLVLAAAAGRGVSVRDVEFVPRVARSLPRSRLLHSDDPSLLAPLSLFLRCRDGGDPGSRFDSCARLSVTASGGRLVVGGCHLGGAGGGGGVD
jgi:hypothetical protein